MWRDQVATIPSTVDRATAVGLRRRKHQIGGESFGGMSGGGNDRMYGGSGSDSIQGEDGEDTLFGDTGPGLLEGGGQDDTMAGGAGNDLLWDFFQDGKGLAGDNVMDGGAGE